MKSVFLIGLPGSGKTTLGVPLAKKLGYQFHDLDDEIEEKTGMIIPEIFEQFGEDYFRRIEKEVLYNHQGTQQAVISTGGGAPCFFDNMKFINQQGRSLFIDVSPIALFDRLYEGGTDNRPLLKGKSAEELLEEIKQKRTQRLRFYQQAHYLFTDDDLSVETILKALEKETR